jgi:hypothetical protein
MIAKSILNKAFQVNRQQQCSIRIRSFRSWLVPEICDNQQLCISNQNFSINYSTTNLKQASLGTLHYKNVKQKLFKQNLPGEQATTMVDTDSEFLVVVVT